MNEILTDIDGLKQAALAELERISDGDELGAWKKEYVGPKGRVTTMLGAMKDVEPSMRKEVGQRLNGLKNALQSALDERQKTLGTGAAPKTQGPKVDVTEPGIDPGLGKSHVISRTIDELIDVFGRMGFSVAHGPEVEDEWHNFIALNIPEDHPARDPLENFYIDGTPLLRTQTSTVQIREMERREPPLRIVSFGRVYRPDEVDATHSFMFHQIEGLYVDRNVSMVDLKTTLLQFAHAYFGAEAQVRLVPSFFPFTEPSAEMYIKMRVKGVWQWVELGGCGLVDPNVFKAVGYDPEEWTGFAFGLGIERIAMRKYGVPDIRWLFENDLRFLRRV